MADEVGYHKIQLTYTPPSPLTDPRYSEFCRREMRRQGWLGPQGGGLGARCQGITEPIEVPRPQQLRRAAEGAELAQAYLNWGPASPDERARGGAVVALLAATFPTVIDARGRRPRDKWAAHLSRAHWHTCAARAPGRRRA